MKSISRIALAIFVALTTVFCLAGCSNEEEQAATTQESPEASHDHDGHDHDGHDHEGHDHDGHDHDGDGDEGHEHK